MKWFGWCGFAITVLVLVLNGSSSSASPTVRIEVDRHVVRTGQQLDVTARSEAECAWSIAWNDQRATGRGTELETSFTAPVVQRPMQIPVIARCLPIAATIPSPVVERRSLAELGSSQRITVGVPQGLRATVTITVLPPRGSVLSPGGGLPSTGGPERWLVLVGLALLFAGFSLQGLTRARARGYRAKSPGA